MCTIATWSSKHWLSASITPRRRPVDFHCTWASFRKMVEGQATLWQAQADINQMDKKNSSAAWSHCKRLISTPKQPLRRRQSPLQSVGSSCISRTLWQLQRGRGVMIVCSQLIVKQSTTSPVAHFLQTLSPKTELYKLGLSVGKTNANHKKHTRARGKLGKVDAFVAGACWLFDVILLKLSRSLAYHHRRICLQFGCAFTSAIVEKQLKCKHILVK